MYEPPGLADNRFEQALSQKPRGRITRKCYLDLYGYTQVTPPGLKTIAVRNLIRLASRLQNFRVSLALRTLIRDIDASDA